MSRTFRTENYRNIQLIPDKSPSHPSGRKGKGRIGIAAFYNEEGSMKGELFVDQRDWGEWNDEESRYEESRWVANEGSPRFKRQRSTGVQHIATRWKSGADKTRKKDIFKPVRRQTSLEHEKGKYPKEKWARPCLHNDDSESESIAS
jgi:hypothetical protein